MTERNQLQIDPSPPDADEVSEAIEVIRSTGLREGSQATIEALLNVIPYAGGSIASIINSYSTKKKIDRICDTLDMLHNRIRRLGTKVEDVLTEEQVVEILEETLPRVAAVSDREKLEFLRNGLFKSFTNTDTTYPLKQFFLGALKNLSILEVRTMRALYLGSDPHFFIETEHAPPADPPTDSGANLIANHATHHAPTVFNFAIASGHRRFKEWRDDSRLPSLREHLASILGESGGIVRGVAAALDRTGLSNALAVLEKRHYRVFIERIDHAARGSSISVLASAMVTGSTVAAASSLSGSLHLGALDGLTESPIEMAQTDLGRGFIEFVRSS